MSYELEAAKKQPLHRRPSCQAFCATIVESYQSFNQGDSVLAARRFASQNAGESGEDGERLQKKAYDSSKASASTRWMLR